MFNNQQIVMQAQSGDNAARQALYDQTIRGVYYIISRLVERREDVEDLVQDTYVSAFSQLDKLTDPQAFVKWLHRIATNTAANHLKKKTPILFATDEQEEQVLGSIPAVGEDFLPEEFAVNQDLREHLMAAIRELPEKQRMAIFLHYYEGTSVKELAETLNVGENTVKSRLNAGRAGIRKHLEKLGITSATMSVLALALRNDAAAASVPAASQAAIWAGVESALVSGVAAAAGTAAGAGTVAAASAKAGIFSALWVKVTAAVLAGAVVVGAGVAVVSNDTPDTPGISGIPTPPPFQSAYGIPEEMGMCEMNMDDPERQAELLPLLTHEFGEPVASYFFDNGTLAVHYYSDGYIKTYVKRGSYGQYGDLSENHYLGVLDGSGQIIYSIPLFPLIHTSRPGDWDTASMISSTDYYETGDFVTYYAPLNHYIGKEPTQVICYNNNNRDNAIFTLTLTSSSGSIPQPEPPVEQPEPPTDVPAPPSTTVTLDTTLLNLTDVTFDEATRRFGSSTYNEEWMLYGFPDAGISLAYAYGKDTGCNYVSCSLDKILINCPSSMTADQLKGYLGGGSEDYDEMDGGYVFYWTYKGCTVFIYPGSNGKYGPNCSVNYNCADRVDQTPAQPQLPASAFNAFDLLGKTQSEMEAIIGHSLYFEGQFGALMSEGVDGSDNPVMAYTDGSAGSGKCVGVSVTLANIIPNCPSSLTLAQLKSKLGDYYKDSWAGTASFCTVSNGRVVTVFPSSEGGSYSPQSRVNIAPVGTTVSGKFGTYWHNYSSADITVTFDKGAARVAITCTQRGQMANYGFADSLILYRGS